MMSRILYQDNFHRIEHHFARDGGSDRVACTFTPFNFYDIESEGFGVNFMLSRGYDVIAFKCINDSWFQQITQETIDIVGNITAQYARVVTYGSSMGGYAAIAFSKALHASSIVAISPQFAIDERSDQRWAKQASGISWKYRITPERVAACSMHLLYDDVMLLDALQVQKIAHVAENCVRDIRHLKFPFSGHPTGTFLAQTGLITTVVSAVLEGKMSESPKIGWQQIKKSSAYFLSLSQFAKSKGKPRLEILALQNAIRLRPDHILAQNLLRDAKNRGAN